MHIPKIVTTYHTGFLKFAKVLNNWFYVDRKAGMLFILVCLCVIFCVSCRFVPLISVCCMCHGAAQHWKMLLLYYSG